MREAFDLNGKRFTPSKIFGVFMRDSARVLGVIVLTASLFAAFFFILKNNVSVNTDIENKTELETKVTSLSKMALLSMKEADAQILMPVKGVKKNRIADTWGAARSENRSHSGQDIFAKKGTPVYSATEGYVLRVGENRLGGKVIFIYGAGGRRYYYAHLDDFAPDLKVGDYVTTDTLLGFVGNTGNAQTTPPHLHFGVYGAGGAMNPMPLLTDRNSEK